MPNPNLPYVLKIGSKRYDVKDLSDASATYQMERDRSGLGSSSFPDGRIAIGKQKYRISYNGNVWKGETLFLYAVRPFPFDGTACLEA